MARSLEADRLRELMRENSILSPEDEAAAAASDLIHEAFSSILEPGEQVLAYADRAIGLTGQTDAFAYRPGGPKDQTDIFAHDRSADNRQTDAFAYDTEEGRAVTDVMGYARPSPAQVPYTETDAFAYSRPEESVQTNIFLARDTRPRPADLDLLVLTDRRLMRGVLEEGSLTLKAVGCQTGGVQVLTSREEQGAECYLGICLPVTVCGPGEGEWWYWHVPQDRDPHELAAKWGDVLR
jgi:hypothetical protein